MVALMDSRARRCMSVGVSFLYLTSLVICTELFVRCVSLYAVYTGGSPGRGRSCRGR